MLIGETNKEPTDYPLPHAEQRGQREDAGLACLLIGGILGLITGFLIGLLF
jgi:hypothetical protein